MGLEDALEELQQMNFEVAMKIEECNVDYTGELLSIIQDVEQIDKMIDQLQSYINLSDYNRRLVNEERFYMGKNMEDIKHAYAILNVALHNILLTLHYPKFQ